MRSEKCATDIKRERERERERKLSAYNKNGTNQEREGQRYGQRYRNKDLAY